MHWSACFTTSSLKQNVNQCFSFWWPDSQKINKYIWYSKNKKYIYIHILLLWLNNPSHHHQMCFGQLDILFCELPSHMFCPPFISVGPRISFYTLNLCDLWISNFCQCCHLSSRLTYLSFLIHNLKMLKGSNLLTLSRLNFSFYILRQPSLPSREIYFPIFSSNTFIVKKTHMWFFN